MNPACETCNGKCCTSFSIEYFQPQLTEGHFKDALDWIGRHHDTFVEDVKVDLRLCRVRVNNPCDYLGADGRCTDYEHRPVTCRLYNCEKMKVRQ